VPDLGAAGIVTEHRSAPASSPAHPVSWRLIVVVAAIGVGLHAVVLLLLDVLGAAQVRSSALPWAVAALVGFAVARSSPVAAGTWVVVGLVWLMAVPVGRLRSSRPRPTARRSG